VIYRHVPAPNEALLISGGAGHGTQGVGDVLAGLVGQGMSIFDLLRKSATAVSANGTSPNDNPVPMDKSAR
jgi:hypothetical protein